MNATWSSRVGATFLDMGLASWASTEAFTIAWFTRMWTFEITMWLWRECDPESQLVRRLAAKLT